MVLISFARALRLPHLGARRLQRNIGIDLQFADHLGHGLDVFVGDLTDEHLKITGHIGDVKLVASLIHDRSSRSRHLKTSVTQIANRPSPRQPPGVPVAQRLVPRRSRVGSSRTETTLA